MEDIIFHRDGTISYFNIQERKFNNRVRAISCEQLNTFDYRDKKKIERRLINLGYIEKQGIFQQLAHVVGVLSQKLMDDTNIIQDEIKF